MTSSAQNSKQVLAQQGSAAVPSYSFLGDQDTGVYRSAANEVSVSTNGTQRVVVGSSGNVGIGTASPTYNLDVNSASGDVTVTARSASGGAAIYRAIGSNSTYAAYNAVASTDGTGQQHWYLGGNGVANTLTFQTNGANERMRITGDGKVGVGTSAPSVTLTTKGRISAYDSSLSADDTGYNGTLCSTRPAASGQHINLTRFGYFVWSVGTVYNTNTFGIGVGQATDSNFSTPVFQISETNKIGVGAAPSSVAKLLVNGSTTGNGNYTIYCQNSSAAANFYVRDDGYSAFGLVPGSWTTGNAANVYMDGNGGLFLSTSSLRYKRDVTEYTRTVADLMKLRPVFYKGKSERDGDTQFAGLIAEEVHAAGLTEFVVYDENGKPNALHYGNMVALCIKTIQELKLEIDKLKGISK